MTEEIARKMVACLNNGAPYSDAAEGFVVTSIGLPQTPFGMNVRVAVCYQVFHAVEAILSDGTDPIRPFVEILKAGSLFMENAGFCHEPFTKLARSTYESIEDETGDHYGDLFQQFDEEHYFNEAEQLLRKRLERNGFEVESTYGKRCLDAGCGGGRYTVALKRLGFKEVVGLDYSTKGIRYAREMMTLSGAKGIRFQQGNVLDLPFEDSSFDFVFSNGVLHHTTDILKGIKELTRVLKKGGDGFLYLIEKPGGIFWDIIEILRPMMQCVPFDFARKLMATMGVPPNRQYYILDHIMVPINIRSEPDEVLAMLEEAGAVDITRLKRGTDFDRVEQIYQNEPYHGIKFGVGENRYFFRKK